MNRWECEKPGCSSQAVGTGGGVGLRAIGWWFELGRGLYCPTHRPDRMPCDQNEENAGNSCSLCASEEEAQRLQDGIRAVLGWSPGPGRAKG